MIDDLFNPSSRTNHKIYNIIKALNIFDNCSLSEYILPDSLNPDYQKLSQILFHCDLESFKRKVSQKEIREEKINRNIIILAGDICLELFNFYENYQEKNPIKVADIHNQISYKIEKSNEYFTETLYFDGFFKDALTFLEENEIIELKGEEYKGTGSGTLCKIMDYLRLLEFIKKHSINYLLYQ